VPGNADKPPAPNQERLDEDAESFEQRDAPESELALKLVPVPERVWDSLPASCLTRMLEFQSVRGEFHRTYGKEPPAAKRDPSRRLALEDIVDLALLNSRQYQAQKEQLYSVAMQLSLERFDYDLKFATVGNGTAANYNHLRTGGTTVNNLTVPTRVTGNMLLATGGDLLARFANDVVLTFNGPSGFAADIGSELLLDVSQSVFQRDIVFEELTQAERNVVYAAREFARFRKELFRDLASQYYSLILAYRAIEIGSQDYFSNLRAFHQGEAEYRAGRRSRVEVDQFEQFALRSRSDLIRGCNALESALDGLKTRIGLPPELPINLDLTELEMLTLRDEVTVSGERVRRARRNVLSERQQPALDRSVLLNAAIDLTRRMATSAELRRRLGQEQVGEKPLELLLACLSADEARVMVRLNRDILKKEKEVKEGKPPPRPMRVYQRTMDLVDSTLALVERELALARKTGTDLTTVEDVWKELRRLGARAEATEDQLEEVVAGRQLDRIPRLVATAEALLADTDALARAVDTATQYEEMAPEEELQETLRHIDYLLAESERLLEEEAGGLAPIEMETDDAMLTALTQRLDIMTQRGRLADLWRHIKLAGDDLKSVLNLNASQAVRTEPNRPFDFTFDESETRLSLTLDTPFNRKAQRNAYRQSLINYQAGLRDLMELEDNVKLSVRDDLRQLLLDREQYQIAVASAALAYDRVVSTRLQLRLGLKDVAARDFLEAQQAYTASLSAVADEHIRHVLDRIQLFLDLESLEVDDCGFWPELYNEKHQPAADFQWPCHACPPYGELPGGLFHSRQVKRMLHVPPGCPEIHETQPHAPNHQEPPPELLPTPEPEGP